MSVSILIPAFRPTFLTQTIASALAQTYEDFELVISDDSGGPELLPIVERFRDTRIRYVATAGRTGAVENVKSLWSLAKFDLVKYLLDDDLMTPQALSDLVGLFEATPEASVAFGRRQIIDDRGRVLREPEPFPTKTVRLDHRAMTANLVGTISNPIGEFSNILISGARVGVSDYLLYKGYEMHVNSDVGFYLNAARVSPCVGVDRVVGCFRKHGEQNSSPAFNPLFAIGICEWELFIRGEYSDGAIGKARVLEATDKLVEAYANWSKSLPRIAEMAPGLAALRTRIADGETAVLDEDFRTRWHAFVQGVLDEKAKRQQPPADAAKTP